jgi:hypothetical protein
LLRRRGSFLVQPPAARRSCPVSRGRGLAPSG